MARRSTLVGIVAVVLLFAAAIFLYFPPLLGRMGAAPALKAGEDLTYVADLDFWQRTPRERIVAATAHFDLNHNLNDVPMTVGNWRGEPAPETNKEVMILLNPEQYVQRLYQDDQGRSLWLTMVGGRSSQPFHAPDICYDADGWQYDLGSQSTALADGGEVYGLWLDAHKTLPQTNERVEHVVYYFYLFPNAQRDQSDGIVLFKLTSGRYGSLEDTLKIQEEFTREFFRAANTAPAAVSMRP